MPENMETALIVLPKSKAEMLRKKTGERYFNRAIYKAIDEYLKSCSSYNGEKKL